MFGKKKHKGPGLNTRIWKQICERVRILEEGDNYIVQKYDKKEWHTTFFKESHFEQAFQHTCCLKRFRLSI